MATLVTTFAERKRATSLAARRKMGEGRLETMRMYERELYTRIARLETATDNVVRDGEHPAYRAALLARALEVLHPYRELLALGYSPPLPQEPA